MTKYRAQPTVVDGIRCDSTAAARRDGDLKVMEKAGLITDLELQPTFPVKINGIKVFTYRADFRYVDLDGVVIEDVKGYKTPLYKLKKKCVEAAYPGVVIIEVV